MNSQDAISTMDDFWSRVHGSPGRVCTPGVHVADCEGSDRVMLLSRGETILVSAPTEIASVLRASEARAEQLLEHGYWMTLPGITVDRIIGPAYLGFLTNLRPAPKGDRRELRVLTEHDAAEIDALRRACAGDEWSHSAIDEDSAFRIGALLNGRIISAAGCQILGDRLAFMGFVTHPDHRREGHGLAAASEAVRIALSRGFLPNWRTLLANVPSINAAGKLGFEQYAVTISVRLSGDARMHPLKS